MPCTYVIKINFYLSSHLQKIYKYFVIKMSSTNEHKNVKHIKEELNNEGIDDTGQWASENK